MKGLIAHCRLVPNCNFIPLWREKRVGKAWGLVLALFPIALPVLAEPGGVIDTEAGTYTIETEGAYTIVEDDVTAAEGLAFVKRGSGTVTAGAVMGTFAGEIRIEEGIWLAVDPGALGTADGGTVVSNGAALHVSSGTRDVIRFAKGEVLTLIGSGPDGAGAYYNAGTQQQYYPIEKGSRIELAGDTTVGTKSANFGVGGGTVALNDHTLTVLMSSNDRPFDFRCEAIVTPGHFNVQKGRLFLAGATEWSGDSTYTITVAAGSQLGMRKTTKPIPYTLVLNPGSIVYPSNGADVDTAGINEWAGPVTLNGTVVIAYSDADNTVSMTGPVSGVGGFKVDRGETLRLACPSNLFTGGVILENDAKLVLDADGALPASGGALTGTSGTVVTRCSLSLPDVVAEGPLMISNAVAGSQVVVGTITQSDSPDATVSLIGGISITNHLDVQGGIVRYGRMGDITVAGLYRAYTNFVDQTELTNFHGRAFGGTSDDQFNTLFTKMFDTCPVTEVDAPDLAYQAWTSAVQYQMAAYKGYFRNNAPTNVVVTFAVNMADVYALWIDGEIIAKLSSSMSYSGGSESTYFLQRGIRVLKPGVHEFRFLTGWTIPMFFD
ncbi:MAG TPA: hypothetical protein P5026_02065 [Kiritimatiellia bacterium]|nr:hypothetical protein [Kiritimatiellia bacterium]HRU69873.1 hypothetical protein [Kiritimatiellia bacterium]